MSSPGLIIVSNRLPVTINKQESGSYESSSSTGGLAGALGGLAESMSFRWFGWPGLGIPQEDEDLVTQQMAKYNVHPIFLDSDLANLYYNGFSNSTLWPLFHYQLHEIGRIDKDAWEAYCQVNILFANALTSQLHDGDSIWVHDYHLMLLPKLIRQRTQESGMKSILEGVLHCDLIGFHTESYARNFLSSCSEILKLPTDLSHVHFHGSTVTIGAFPIGIQPERFAETIQRINVQNRIRMLSRRYQGAKLIVSIDRLDYIKGVPQKLHALETFLTLYPEWVGRVVLMQVAVPTRQDVEEYQSLQTEVNELVGRLNGKHGSIEFSPVSFLYRSLDFEEIVALYAVSDICLVSSTRGGMNLVSLEYIASQRLKHGSLVLSEFTGAAEVLDGSIIFNLWDVEESVDALHKALTMSEEERAENFEKVEEYVMRNTSSVWGKAFTDCLMKS